MSNQEENIKNLSQTWPIPTKTSPIIIIGTGGIVKDAHLPAYKKAGFNVAGLYDVDKEKGRRTLIIIFGMSNAIRTFLIFPILAYGIIIYGVILSLIHIYEPTRLGMI